MVSRGRQPDWTAYPLVRPLSDPHHPGAPRPGWSQALLAVAVLAIAAALAAPAVRREKEP